VSARAAPVATLASQSDAPLSVVTVKAALAPSSDQRTLAIRASPGVAMRRSVVPFTLRSRNPL